MAYPQGYLYQPSASLALYSCPAYSTSVISGPRTDELGRSSSGSAFAPYAGSTAFTSASPGYNSHLPYSADAAAAATFTSYVVSALYSRSCVFFYFWKLGGYIVMFRCNAYSVARTTHNVIICARFAVLTIKYAFAEFG